MRYTLSFFLVSLWLAGCGSIPMATGLFENTRSNLIEYNYAAADMLQQQAGNQISGSMPIIAVPLRLDSDAPEVTPFGRMTAEQVSSRFVQLGYNVQWRGPAVIEKNSEKVLDLSKEESVQGAVITTAKDLPKRAVILSGTYAPVGNDLAVSLKLRRARDDRIISAFDYRIPYTGDLVDFAEPNKEPWNPFAWEDSW